MATIRVSSVELCYETFGDPAAPPLVLVMGLGAQMVLWDEGFCEALVERGFHVVRFDNRDVGLSTHLHDAGLPDVQALLRGERVPVPYDLSDMARDTAELIAGLGFGSAHVVGASMGGMIAQTLAIEHPERVRSLVSIMSSTGAPDLPPPRPDAMAALLAPPPRTREEAIERAVELQRTIGSPGFPFDEARVLERAALQWDRGFDAAGVSRQLAAILASGSRRERLGAVRCPALVIHGDADPLVPLEAGLDTAKAIPGAELLVIEGMGHDLPPATWERIADAIARTARRAEADAS